MEYKYKAIGWIRDRKGKIIRYNIKDVCNCITPFGAGGSGFKDADTGMANTTPYVLIQYGETIKF